MIATQLVELGQQIVSEAKRRGGTIRLFGGVAIYAVSPSVATHPSLQREYVDLDFIAAEKAWPILPDVFSACGFQLKENKSGKLTFIHHDVTADVRGTRYIEYHMLDFGPRLDLAPLTPPLVDLLLLKLQRVDFREKDIKDAIALLLDHRITEGGDESEEINRQYLYQTTNREWGLWTTVFDNTVQLEKILDRYLEPEEAQLVWRRIEQIQEVMDGKGKSAGWWLRSIPNRHVRWYRQPSH